MYKREIEDVVSKEASSYPVLAFIGPRQSGKTTLAKKLFKNYEYVLLESLENRRLATEDPKAFFKKHSGNLILDEVQKAPELLSEIQGIVDAKDNQRQFILSGSENLLLSSKISQSLAGRVRIYTLLPFSKKEIFQKNDFDLNELLLTGAYPRIYDQKLLAHTWLDQYYLTYVEKDIRQLKNISNLSAFEKVIRLFAGRVSSLLDYSGVANDSGVSQVTVKSWLSVLRATYICFQLEPYYKNFNKRIIKSPKLYFHDTGLLCYLLRIKTKEQLESHPLYGNIFENWVVSEKLKSIYNKGESSNIYFWRGQNGLEIDLLEENASELIASEIKSAQTFTKEFKKNLNSFAELQKSKKIGRVIYGGDESQKGDDFEIISWKNDF